MDLTLQHIIDNRPALLSELDGRQEIVRDYTRAVVGHYSPGLQLHGPPGTAKTYTVRDVLEREFGAIYPYHHGHLTPLGLFELIDKYRDQVLVLDDLSSLFRNEIALQILLSALEYPTTQDKGRVVKYRRQGGEQSTYFRGGIICISNCELHDQNLLNAFKSRVHVLNYNPTDAQLGALMLELAEQGWPADQPSISPGECRQVAEFVITEILRRGRRFDLRLFVNKGLPIYQQVKDGEAESDWRDLVTAAIDEELVEVRYGNGQSESRAERKAEEHCVLQEILKKYATRAEQVEAWTRTTGKSGRAFYRRLGEIQ